jgi:hypothetical protein
MSPETAYAWIANVDPVAGEPAVLGELWRRGPEEQVRVPMEPVRGVDPTLYAALVRLAEAADQPVRSPSRRPPRRSDQRHESAGVR